MIQHELSVTRLIDAPRDVVYRVWTERTGEWWAPKPWATPVVEFDLRPGGRAFTEMESPEGEHFPNEGIFLEVVPNERIVLTDALAPGWVPQEAFMVVIVTFEEESGKTRYTARVRHWDEEALKRHEAMGFHQGWGQVADQLAELAEREKVAA